VHFLGSFSGIADLRALSAEIKGKVEVSASKEDMAVLEEEIRDARRGKC